MFGILWNSKLFDRTRSTSAGDCAEFGQFVWLKKQIANAFKLSPGVLIRHWTNNALPCLTIISSDSLSEKAAHEQ